MDPATISAVMAIGGTLGGLFGGGQEDYGKYYDEAMKQYKEYMDKALESINQHETQGRTDLTDYLAQSQEFGVPYREAGTTALSSYLGSLGLGGAQARQSALESFHASPAYQSALNQGLSAIERNNAAGGGRNSGAEKKALMNYATDLANKEYGTWQNQLAGLVNTGQQSSESAAQRSYGTGGSLANLGLGYSQQITGAYSDIAQAMAEAQMAKAQAAAQQSASQGGGLGSLMGGLGF